MKASGARQLRGIGLKGIDEEYRRIEGFWSSSITEDRVEGYRRRVSMNWRLLELSVERRQAIGEELATEAVSEGDIGVDIAFKGL